VLLQPGDDDTGTDFNDGFSFTTFGVEDEALLLHVRTALPLALGDNIKTDADDDGEWCLRRAETNCGALLRLLLL